MIKILAILSFVWTAQARLHAPRSLELSSDKQAAIDLILNPPALELMLDDMEDNEDKTLLQLCQGDCQSDEDCVGNLVCFAREGGEGVPGCSVSMEDFTTGIVSISKTATESVSISQAAIDSLADVGDFCVYPFAELVVINDEGDATNDAGDFTLGLCQGNCASDEECSGDSICYFRAGIMDPVPGCTVANTEGVDGNFCVSAIYKDTESYLNGATAATPAIPEMTFNDDMLFPLEITGNNGEPESAFPLTICQGDCDNDEECGQGLMCLQRGGASDPVPAYCSGNPGGKDYCVAMEGIGLVTFMTSSNMTTPMNTTASPTMAPSLEVTVTTKPNTTAPSMAPTTLAPTSLEYQFPLEDAGNNGEPESAFPLSICQGDCDNDEDCGQGLMCLERGDVSDPVPIYCTGNPTSKDYCVAMEGVSLVDFVTGTSETSEQAPTTTTPIITAAPTMAPTTMEYQFPLESVGDNGEPESVFPLSICQGDCDNDNNCGQGLMCLQRTDESDPVPTYCVGDLDDETDYCVAMEGVNLADFTQEEIASVTPSPTDATETQVATEAPQSTPSPTPAPTEAPETTPSPTRGVTQPPVATTVAPGSGSVAPIGTWEPVIWNELPDNVREAAVVLGHDEDSWNNYGDGPFDNMYWNELPPEQQAAAAVFGYDEQSWDGEGSWSTMTPDEQTAAAFLGYDEASWNGDVAQAVDDLCWDDLSSAQQDAAGVLGYDQDGWDQGEC